jgi:hypothetical protein
MRMRRLPVGFLAGLLAGLCLSSLAPGHAAPPARTKAGAASQAVTVSAARGTARAQLLGKPLNVRGFYLSEPAPMLIRNRALGCANTLLPPESYLLLTGDAPAGAQDGDEVSLAGVLREPGASATGRLRGQSAVLELATGASATVLGRVSTQVARPAASRQAGYDATMRMMAAGRPGAEPVAHRAKYAIIISAGDSNSMQWRGRYVREIAAVHQMYRQRGYAEDAIFILTGSAEEHGEVLGQVRACTLGAVELLFDQLAAVMTSGCLLSVYITGSGGGFYDQQMGEETPSGCYGGVLDEDGDEDHEWTLERLCHQDLNGDGDQSDRVAYDEIVGLAGDEVLTDDALARNVAKITHYARMVFFLQSSFSGGFSKDLAGTNRIILTACAEKQWAWATSPAAQFSEFTRLLVTGHNRQPASNCAHLWSLYAYIYANDQASLESTGYLAVPDGLPHYGFWSTHETPALGAGWAYF